MIMNKDQIKEWCQELADQINGQLKNMTDEEAQFVLDSLSESFFRLGDNREDH